MTNKLILIHGFLGNARNWTPIIYGLQKLPIFQSGWEITAIDLLGHGTKLSYDGPLEMINIVQDLDLSLPKEDGLYVLGHSFGFKPLLSLAARQPDRFKLLIAEDSGPFMSDGAFLEVSKVFNEIHVPFSSREIAREEIYKVFGDGSNMSKFLLSLIREVNLGEHRWKFRANEFERLLKKNKDEALWKEWETYTGDLVLLRGKNSKYLTHADLELLKKRRTSMALECIEFDQSAHWIHADEPVKFIDCLAGLVFKRIS